MCAMGATALSMSSEGENTSAWGPQPFPRPLKVKIPGMGATALSMSSEGEDTFAWGPQPFPIPLKVKLPLSFHHCPFPPSVSWTDFRFQGIPEAALTLR